MNLKNLRASRKRSRWLDGIYRKNPVLCLGLAIPFAVMITTNLKNSVSISILLACSLIPTVLLASLVGKYLAEWLAPIVYTVFSMILVIASIPLILPISPEISDSLGIYIPILSVNTILLTLCFQYGGETKRPVFALVDALAYSVGFALVLCLIAFVRELIGNGTLWGIPVAFPLRASGLQVTFAGFLITAFFCALLRFIRRLTLAFTCRLNHPKPE